MSSSQFQLPECPATGSSIAGSSIDIERPSASTSSRGSSNANASRAGGGSSLSVCEGRQRLQRGAKDKVYATRLAYDYNSSRDDNKYVESTAVVVRGCGAATATASGVATDTSNSRNATRVKRRNPDGNNSDTSSHLRSDDGTKKRKRRSSSIGERKSQPTSNGVVVVAAATATATLAPLAPNEWACNRCTCSNSSRRKKCQACGIPRCVMIDSDGTCMLDELCKARNDKNIGGIINCKLGSKQSTPSTTTTSASDDHCFLSQKGEMQQQQQSQVFVMMKEPLYTRSKRKERLSQAQSLSMTQSNDRDHNNDEQAAISQPQHPSSSHEQQPTLALPEPQQYEGESKLQQWIRKRHTAKRQKRQRGKVRTVDDDGNNDNPSIVESALSSPGEMKYVAVQIRSWIGDVPLNLVHRNDLPENDSDQSSLVRLSAIIPSSVLARIPAQPDDNARNKSLGEIREVSVRIRAAAGDTTLPSAHQQDESESADANQSTNFRLTACIPEAVLSRISVQPNTQQEEYNETEVFAHSNDDGSCDRNNGAYVRELPNSELQQSPSCDGHTGKDVAPTDAMIQGDGNSNDMQKMRERHVSSLESELQREDDTSHQLIDVSCPIIEGIQAKATAPDSSYTNTLERCRAVERTLQMSPSETHPPTEPDSSGGIIISTTKRCSSDDLASKLAHELLDNNAYISKVPPTSHVQHSSQGSVSVDSPFIPMTQQPLDFDYFSQISQTSFGTPKSADIGWMKLTQVVMEEPHGMDNETSKIPECMPIVNSYNRTNHLFYNSPEIGTNLRSKIGSNQTTHHATEGQIGFATAGSGTAISVSDEHLAKATKLLADDNNSLVDRAMTCDNSDGDSPTPTGNDSASSCTDDKTKETTTIDMPRPSLGFASAGSGSLIFISDENLSKAAKLLADGNDDSLIDRTMTSDYDDGGTTLSTSIGISTSYTDATTTANNSCIAPRTALGFASAGNGSLIQVSEESLSRATNLLADSNDRAVDSTSRIGDSKKYHISSVETSSSSNSFGFATAGSGAFIRVSDEELSRASKLLAVKTIDDPTSNVDSYRSSTGTEKICTTSFEAPRSHHGFASAGSGALIQISNESLIRASALLADSNDCLVERVMTCDDDHDDTSATCNDGKHSSHTDSLFYPTAFDAPCVSLGFSSAGGGALILVSDESLSRASKLLADSTERSISNTDTDEHETRTPCIGNRRSIHPPIADTNTNSPFSSMATHSNIGFASAGSGAVITVSDESLLRASSLLADTNDCFEQQAMTIDETQRASNEENMTFRGPEKNYLQSLELSGAPLGFTCAGSGSLIKISDESLSRSTLLADSDDCLVTREMTLNGKHDDTNDDGYPTRADTITLPTSSSDASWTSFGFASAGSGSLIRISDESLSRASKLLEERDDCLTGPALSCDDEHTNYCPSSTATIDIPSISVGFTSAGSGSLIFASDESLTKASKLLAENDGEDYQVMFDAEHDSTNFRTSEDGSTCIETTHLDRNLSENKNRRHGNQKVRFSLDTSQSTYRQQPTVTPSIYNSDHATDAKTQCAGPTVLLCNSRKTPDHRHVDEDTAFGSRNCNGYARQNDTDYKSHTPCHSESNHRANIVTDRKDTPASAIQSSLEDMHTSPHGNSTRTPLFEMTNIVGDPLQSVMKSKRLFQATGSEGNEHRSNVDKSKMLDVALNGVSTLRQFAVNHHATEANSWAECTEYGVKDATMQVNSVNAIKLRFSLDDDSPLFFLGQRNPPKGNHVGKIADIRAWLCSQECDKSLISDKWIQNHVRWIVWKLAAMERRFPVQLGGQYLTYSHVLSQMKGRYEKELRFAKRPALRKVLNRDVSASMPIILCVSQILRFQPKKHVDGGNGSVGQNNSEEVRLELSDGWYAVSAILDCVLTTMIEGGKIRVGSKLMICNAQLVGTDDGVDPLDDDFSSDRRNCPIFLKITANNSRLAKWDAMLGFVHPKYTANQGGGILTKSLSDIFPDGGNIPAVDVVICKRYPRMFLEQVKDVAGQTIATNHLTEAEEAARENDHDMIHQRTSEHYAEHACKECSEEIDEDAPTEWNAMVASISPEEYYENLPATEQKIVDEWSKKRQVLMQNKVAKSIEGSVKDNSLSERISVPYLRVLVKSFYRSKKGHRHAKRNVIAELTIWRVSEDQLQLMREGTVVRIKNISVRSDHEGILQLSAKGDTYMESSSSQPTQIQLIRSGYEERRPRSLIYINLMAKKFEPNRFEREVDVVACIVKIQRLDSTTSTAYLTDESGFVMKLTRTHSSNNSDPFQIGNVEASLPTVVELCNVYVTSVDSVEHCAIGSWGTFTCKARHSMRLRYEEIQDWCNSASGLENCSSILERINAGLPSCATPFNRCMCCIGHILGFEIEETSLEMNAIVDYGEEFSLKARFPFCLLLHALRLIQSNSSAFDGIDITSILAGNMFNRTNILSTCNILGEYFRSNQILFRFSLERSSCYGVDLQCHEVTDISVAAIDSLCRLNAIHCVGKE